MVQWMTDPENAAVMIPRFKDATEMGIYYEKTKFTGKCGADYQMFMVAKERLPGKEYAFAYKHSSPFFVIPWAAIITVAIVMVLLYLAIIFIALPFLSAIGVLSDPGTAKVKELIPGCTCPPYELCPTVVSYPDGSTATIDQCTGEVIGTTKAPITIGSVLLYGAIFIAVGVGGYLIYKVVIPKVKKKLHPPKKNPLKKE